MFVFSWLITALWKPRPNKADLFALRSHLSCASFLLLLHWVKTQSCKDKCFFSLRPTLMKTNADSFTNKLELYLGKRVPLKYNIFLYSFFSPPTPPNSFSRWRFSSIHSSYVVVVVWFLYLFPMVIFRITSDCSRNEADTYVCIFYKWYNYLKNSFARIFVRRVQVEFYTPSRLLSIYWKILVDFLFCFLNDYFYQTLNQWDI